MQSAGYDPPVNFSAAGQSPRRIPVVGAVQRAVPATMPVDLPAAVTRSCLLSKDGGGATTSFLLASVAINDATADGGSSRQKHKASKVC